jgi:hypothetical protein
MRLDEFLEPVLGFTDGRIVYPFQHGPDHGQLRNVVFVGNHVDERVPIGVRQSESFVVPSVSLQSLTDLGQDPLGNGHEALSVDKVEFCQQTLEIVWQMARSGSLFVQKRLVHFETSTVLIPS